MLYTSEGLGSLCLDKGVLMNPQRIAEPGDSANRFQAIERDEAAILSYTISLDVIGYGWKQAQCNVITGNVFYFIRQGSPYIFREKEGYYCKLRFTGFYNYSGEKRFPLFEFRRL